MICPYCKKEFTYNWQTYEQSSNSTVKCPNCHKIFEISKRWKDIIIYGIVMLFFLTPTLFFRPRDVLVYVFLFLPFFLFFDKYIEKNGTPIVLKKKKIRNKKLILITMIVPILISSFFYFPIFIKHNPLPSNSEIQSINYNYNVPLKKIHFKGIIPVKNRQDFLLLFDDAYIDVNPAKWQRAGSCTIKLKNGNRVDISLFWTTYGSAYNKISAMRIGNKYYRVSYDKDFLNFFKKLNGL